MCMKKLLLALAVVTLPLTMMAQAAALPFFEDFESSTLIPSTFTLINVDGNTPASAPASLADSAFIVRYNTNFESQVAYGVSYYTPDAGADDWLILPKLALTDNPVLSWKALSLTSSGNYPDTYQVLVSTTDTEIASFTSIFEVEEEVSLSAGGAGVQKRMLDLGAAGYANQEVYIAFRLMTPSPGGDRLALDDIRVVDMLNEGFENGIPDSWTVIDGGTAGMTWIQDDYEPYEGEYSAGLDTYDDAGNETDDWLITSAVTVNEGHVLSFWAVSADSDYPDDLHVMASKTGVTAEDFTITIADLTPVSAAGWTKYSYVLSENAELSDGDEIYIGFWCDSEGSFLNIDLVKYGEVVPPKMMRAYAVSETAVDVLFDADLEGEADPGAFTLSGTADLTFSGAEVDGENKALLHLTGTSASMEADVIVDILTMADQEDAVEFYGGILPLSFTSLTNPEGTMDFDDHHATFKAIVMAINSDTSRVWLADASGAHHGINTYDMVTDGLALGDELLFYGKMSPYQAQTEIYPATQLEVLSSGNELFAPTMITGADIATTVEEDNDPAEQYEGVLVSMEGVEVSSWDGAYFNCTDDGGATVFYVADYDELYDGEFGENTLTAGNTYDLTGIIVGRNGEYRLVPRSADDIVDVTSIEDQEGKALRIYPVPVSDLLHIDHAVPMERIQVMAASGQIITDLTLHGKTSVVINTRAYYPGVYVIRIMMKDESVVVRKLMKK